MEIVYNVYPIGYSFERIEWALGLFFWRFESEGLLCILKKVPRKVLFMLKITEHARFEHLKKHSE